MSSGIQVREKRLPQGPDWTFELIDEYEQEIRKTAAEFGLDTYPNQIEVITSEQMLDAYASVGLPIGYPHWSFGKEFIRTLAVGLLTHHIASAPELPTIPVIIKIATLRVATLLKATSHSQTLRF